MDNEERKVLATTVGLTVGGIYSAIVYSTVMQTFIGDDAFEMVCEDIHSALDKVITPEMEVEFVNLYVQSALDFDGCWHSDATDIANWITEKIIPHPIIQAFKITNM